ncbi:hypothetical protein CERSUDRAFT_115234 [Gelatoporia subvermispora B]|uniref:Uncharacterized protein n=1 Tax=Ceriporiopsis subvermispora (strain B) TaxID=914234 RepID=M2PJA3_CERS8|nr:hypothetical protein CERSUDRAFT_115234 [Gelatoporia subvermispora B]
MSFFDKAKDKLTGHSTSQSNSDSQQSEQTYSIQPHPAKTNDPRDSQGGPQYGGLNADPDVQAFHARGPYVPNQELLNKVDKPLGRDELNARAAELNKRDANDVVNPGADASGI